VKDLTYRGYRKFLYPVDQETGLLHRWSFLYKQVNFQTEAGKYKYDLPVDYDCLVVGPKYSNGEDQTPPEVSTLSKLHELRTISTTTGRPSFYAVFNNNFTEEFGSTQDLWLWRTPDAAYDFYYVYTFNPDKPEDDNDYFIGTPLASEVILQCSLGMAQLQEDELEGEQLKSANDMLRRMIAWDKLYNITPVEEEDASKSMLRPRPYMTGDK
jgi:hypothetical protein